MRVSPDWLDLREPADRRARAAELVGRLELAGDLVIHDLGAGTGSMGRWLAPRLAGEQHWVLHDRDADLLSIAAIDVPGVTIETRVSDVTALRPADLAGADLITASALLDMLTAQELGGLLDACAGAGCPVLLTMTVAGRVAMTPPDPLDGLAAAAFDDHQRRETERGRLLGPDAVTAAVEALGLLGAEVVVAPSPWRLGPADAELAKEWFGGWLDAACEQRPELAAQAAPYRRRRLEQLVAGQLAVTVDHADLLVAP